MASASKANLSAALFPTVLRPHVCYCASLGSSSYKDRNAGRINWKSTVSDKRDLAIPGRHRKITDTLLQLQYMELRVGCTCGVIPGLYHDVVSFMQRTHALQWCWGKFGNSEPGALVSLCPQDITHPHAPQGRHCSDCIGMKTPKSINFGIILFHFSSTWTMLFLSLTSDAFKRNQKQRQR